MDKNPARDTSSSRSDQSFYYDPNQELLRADDACCSLVCFQHFINLLSFIRSSESPKLKETICIHLAWMDLPSDLCSEDACALTNRTMYCRSKSRCNLDPRMHIVLEIKYLKLILHFYISKLEKYFSV